MDVTRFPRDYQNLPGQLSASPGGQWDCLCKGPEAVAWLLFCEELHGNSEVGLHDEGGESSRNRGHVRVKTCPT